jgi:hypothetical protein
MTARFEWTGGLIRFYDTDLGADARGPYAGVVSVSRCGPSHAYLFGLHATMTRQVRQELAQCLIENGITHTTDVRHGRWHERDLLAELARHQTGATEND